MGKSLVENSMQELQNGNLAALDSIYNLTSKNVYYISYYILKNTEHAKDIVHDTYIHLIKNIDKYKLKTNAMAWITRMARNLSLDLYDKLKRNVSLEMFEDKFEDKIDYLSVVEDSVYLKNAIKILNLEEREILILYGINCLKHDEIAKIVEKPVGTVRWIYNKAIKKLKQSAENDFKEEFKADKSGAPKNMRISEFDSEVKK